MRFLEPAAMTLWLFASVLRKTRSLRNDYRWQIQIDPRILQTDATTSDGKSLPLSAATHPVDATELIPLQHPPIGGAGDVTIHVELENDAFSLRFTATNWQSPGPLRRILAGQGSDSPEL